MFSFRNFLFSLVFLFHLNSFGMCAHVFSGLKTHQLGLSDKVVRVLYRAGIHTIEDLTSRTDRELMELPHLGKTAFKKVKAALTERGLSLATSSDPTSVESLGFSVRVSNVFYDEGIRTIGDLISRTEEELVRLPGFGKKSLTEVKMVLAERGLSLISSVSLSSVYSLGLSGHTNNVLYRVDIHTIEDLTSRTEKELVRLPDFGKKSLREVKAALTERGLSLVTSSDPTSVESLGFSPRIENIFYDEGIRTIGDLISRTEEELVMPNFGRKSLREVKAALTERGLSLATSSDPTSVESLGFSVRVRNAFYHDGIHTIEDLTSRTEKELVRLPNFGRKSLREVKSALAKSGLSLASTPSDSI